MKSVLFSLLLAPSCLLALPGELFDGPDDFAYLRVIESNIAYYQKRLDALNLPCIDFDENLSEEEKQLFLSGCLDSLKSIMLEKTLYENHH